MEHGEGKKRLNADALSSIPDSCSNDDLEPECQECKNSVDEWQDFKENNETITDLSKRGKQFSARIASLDSPCNWMYQFSITEMIDFQKQVSDLNILYQWLEQEKLPSRDEVAQFSPAVRNVWLNWEGGRVERREEKDGRGDEEDGTGNEKNCRRVKKAESEKSKLKIENRNLGN